MPTESTRQIPRISLHDWDNRKNEIQKEIMNAAENVGFFIIKDQDSPSKADIEEAFRISEFFFRLPEDVKSRTPFIREQNTGWEKRAQIRPSTNLPDQKESIQLQYHRRYDPTWPVVDDHIPDFHKTISGFMEKTQTVSMRILSCLAIGLGLEEDYFTKIHDIKSNEAMTTLRLLHYHESETRAIPDGHIRAGAHTDYDFLTLLFQRTGEDGLEVCPGRECYTSFGMSDIWTPVKANTGEIVCNIGDMLMSLSDDRLKSLFHRVRNPRTGESQRARHSIAFFNQPIRSAVIQGPLKKYPPITARDFILDAARRNYAQGEKEREDAIKSSKFQYPDNIRPGIIVSANA
ncbi:hypothetical protein TWF106_003185 [Orbilia oligospora]|uniref:Fe2OG dioxygenase domain-containing protein n=1 Tax=Orbilia oligospora TaxID=2813651 RepID=A0A6G1M754_ORBOL|nr:hypothetical protein TWF106_003185 [Orbilia oligospora]KAF3202849.1 hypothetical protein TWF679_010635 [Orbilia oligospora]KAF3211857.1 hypothetical protein TWF191_010673 [Orbilia oligospora]KAF3246943.1 hypothetical protein TWF192_006752 [Orbilia oligospora]